MIHTTRQKAVFKNEAELCRIFMSQLPSDWIAYPEVCGFDIVLLSTASGTQIGIEAKMVLNAKVLLQAVEGLNGNHSSGEPDFRACLIPYGCGGAEMIVLAGKLGLTVIEMKDRELYLSTKSKYVHTDKFTPPLPGKGQWYDRSWKDQMPAKQLTLPEYVPDVIAGASSPMQLSEWKIKAIKISIIMERRGYVTGIDFASIHIDKSRWVQCGWIKMSETRGRYIPGPYALDLRKQHPKVYPQIEADFEKWMDVAKLSTTEDPEAAGKLL